MKAKLKLVRVGRCLIDKELFDEGYSPQDIIEEDDPIIELPELLDPEKRRHVGWMICPDCGERSQIDRRQPICSNCGWEKDSEHELRLTKCVA